MHLHWQPMLIGSLLSLRPMEPADYQQLALVASDPLIWEQHPVCDRYKPEVFADYLRTAEASGGALTVTDNNTGEIIGASRYYDWQEKERQITIGYSFFARRYWGAGYNSEMKQMMLDHAFLVADCVLFTVGLANFRSQRAIAKTGAVFTGENGTKMEFRLSRRNWLARGGYMIPEVAATCSAPMV